MKYEIVYIENWDHYIVKCNLMKEVSYFINKHHSILHIFKIKNWLKYNWQLYVKGGNIKVLF